MAQGTAFTYQGRLNDGANPANGNYDLRFAHIPRTPCRLSPLEQSGRSLTRPLAVTNGLFNTPSRLTQSASAFPGADRWLEIGVRTNSILPVGGGLFTTLSPRQKLSPAPYAILAKNLAPGAGLSGVLFQRRDL